jgi:hypothetical protein
MSKKTERRQVVAAELDGLDHGDKRRNERGILVATRLANSPGASLPTAMKDDAELEGAYAHFSAEQVTLLQTIEPHVAKTRERVLEAGLALVLHDTTDFVFGGEVLREGLGPVYGKDQGFLAHLSIAVSAQSTRTPFGLLAIGTRVRESVGKPTGVESRKWRLGIEASAEGLPVQSLIHVADRESDLYSLVSWCIEGARRFIFRAAYDRAVLLEKLGQEVRGRLFEAIREVEPMELEVPSVAVVSKRGKRKRPTKEVKRFPVRAQRLATLAYSATTMQVKRPAKGKNKVDAVTVTVNVVRAWEPNPPEGVQAIEWVLLTTEPVGTAEEIRQVVEWYRARWVIEEFNKTLKSGCKYEESQLETAERLFALLGYCVVVAYGMLLMRTLARSKEQVPASHFFSTTQLKCLRALSKRVKLTEQPTLTEAFLACAGIGGHLKRNGLPGWQTLSSGYSTLLAYELGYLAALKDHPRSAE